MPTLSFSSLLNTFRQAYTPPARPDFTPAPRTVLISGANTGLGLAAAHHFIALGTTTVLLAVRTPATGYAAAQELRAAAAAPQSLTCHVLQVDFAVPQSVRLLVREVDHGVARGAWPPVDVAVLNAGIISRTYERAEGCAAERTLQVNSLGNLLAAILLHRVLQRRQASDGASLRDDRDNDNEKEKEKENVGAPKAETYTVPQLVLVSSILYSTMQLSSLPPTTGPILPALSDPARPFATQAQYALSKLLLQLGVSQLAELTTPLPSSSALQDEDKRRRTHEADHSAESTTNILVTTVCPGPCQSDLARDFQNSSLVLRLGLMAYAGLFQRTAEQGARSIVSAVGAAAGLPSGQPIGESSGRRNGGGNKQDPVWTQGGFWRNDAFEPLTGILGTSDGKAWAKKAWEEIVLTLGAEVEEVKEIVRTG